MDQRVMMKKKKSFALATFGASSAGGGRRRRHHSFNGPFVCKSLAMLGRCERGRSISPEAHIVHATYSKLSSFLYI